MQKQQQQKYQFFSHLGGEIFISGIRKGPEVSLYTSDTGVGPLSPLDNPGSSPSRLSVIK